MINHVTSWLSGLWRGGAAVLSRCPARRAQLAEIHGDSFHRGWGEGEFESMLTERNTLVHRLRLGRKIIGFAVSHGGRRGRNIVDRRRCEPARRGCPRSVADASRSSRRRGVRKVFLEVGKNQPARRLYEWPDLRCRARERYYREANGEQLNALLMRRLVVTPAVAQQARRKAENHDRTEVPVALKATGIEARCAATGMRMTEQRRVIARVLAEALDHPDVEELYRRCVASTTRYRSRRCIEPSAVRRCRHHRAA